MIEIDGSHGEGGGQILRTSVALSALTMKPVRITKIRAGRSKPGLMMQHIAGIDLLARIVDAEVKGLEVGSADVTFEPANRRGGQFSYDVGTAGALSLVLQAVLPAAALSDGPLELELRGGTDVSWSPPIDYISNVLVHHLKMVGLKVEIVQVRRGHYPRGGGLVKCRTQPSGQLKPITLIEFGSLQEIQGVSHCVRLPGHVATRQAAAAKAVLRRKGMEIVSVIEESYPADKDAHLGPGSGIVLWATSETGARLGADSLGEKGKPAEAVGTEAAEQLLSSLSTGMAFDAHLSDMLVPYLGLASGMSKIGVAQVSSHLLTNIWVAERILGCRAEVQGQSGDRGVLTVEGVGLSSATA